MLSKRMLIPQTMFVNTFLHELNPSIRAPAVCVTVVSKRYTITVPTMLKKSYMVFVDQKGSTIQATLYENLESSNISMDEGDWFEIRNFKLVPASALTRLSRHKYQIEMSASSLISKIQPKTHCNYYCFQRFRNVLRGFSHPMYCIDLYGALVGVGDLVPFHDEALGGINHKINFSLIDIEFDEIKCVAYGNKAIEFYQKWNSTVAPVILCVLNFWRIEWGEGRLKHVTNIEEFSKILIEPEIPEVQAFRMRIPRNPYRN